MERFLALDLLFQRWICYNSSEVEKDSLDIVGWKVGAPHFSCCMDLGILHTGENIVDATEKSCL
jgi:hypothetical protein